MRSKNLVQIGTVGIDAGMLMLADPCYVIDKPLGKMDWGQFLDALYAENGEDAPYWPVNTVPHEGVTRTFTAGLVVTTGDGDGEYPVYAELRGGRVRRIIVDFG